AGAFPYPSEADVAAVARAISQIEAGSLVVVDSLILGAIPDPLAARPARTSIVALMHLPLAAAPDLPRDRAAAIAEREGRALAEAALVIATGAAGAALLEPYSLSRDRMAVVTPGTDRAPAAHRSRDGIVRLLAAGTINAIKGHDRLLAALAPLAGRPWRLTCAGSLERDPATAAAVRESVARLSLGDQVALIGDLDRDALARVYDSTDVFVSASRLETYGMAVAEALARGLPIVTTRTGDLSSLIEGRAGLVVDVDDTAGMTAALRRVIMDGVERQRLAAGAAALREQLPTWDEAAARFAGVLAGVGHHG
ncbi:MAG: glycosyltransferase family 4 protein, partial [Vicinamibacteria bacterium]